jgi:STE24 endopeptidase
VGAGAAGATGLVLATLSPVLIEPMFQKARPLEDPGLEREVLDLAGRAGVSARRVLVNDASRRTTGANAYVSGLGASRRIVLFDTLLRDFPRDQVRFVVAHEVAHVARRHILKGAAWSTALALPIALGAFAAVGWRTGFAAPPPGPAGADLVLRRMQVASAAFGLAGLVAGPVGAWVSRHHEREAEWSALLATGDPDAAIGLQKGVVRRNLSVPDPPRWLQAWAGSHPTALERIAMAEVARRHVP